MIESYPNLLLSDPTVGETERVGWLPTYCKEVKLQGSKIGQKGLQAGWQALYSFNTIRAIEAQTQLFTA